MQLNNFWALNFQYPTHWPKRSCWAMWRTAPESPSTGTPACCRQPTRKRPIGTSARNIDQAGKWDDESGERNQSL